jgi:hypothetical protein
MKNLGHTMYDPTTIDAKLAFQCGINLFDATSRTSFRDFVVNVQHFCVYLAMLGGQPHLTMVNTQEVYYSINPTTSAYQGGVLVFIGDRRAMKEPNPVCLPTTKTWEWYEDHFAIEASQGTLWTPGTREGTSGAIQVPHLLAIPNALVNLLRTHGPATTPHDALMTVDDFILSSLHLAGPQ